MQVNPAKAAGHAEYQGQTYYFCCVPCLNKFQNQPGAYLAPVQPAIAPAPAGKAVEYTCPMHPEVLQMGPGACPYCGMALEPVHNADSRIMPRGFDFW
jgi:Cu+-exporting ATPase